MALLAAVMVLSLAACSGKVPDGREATPRSGAVSAMEESEPGTGREEPPEGKTSNSQLDEVNSAMESLQNTLDSLEDVSKGELDIPTP